MTMAISPSEIMMNAAMAYLHSGLSVLPASLRQKRPVLPTWSDYQRRLPREDELRKWFAGDHAVCVICGAVSGSLEMIDFDYQGEAFGEWYRLVSEKLPGLPDRLVIEKSQSDGLHVIYRAGCAIPGNQKLCQRVTTVETAEPVVIAGKTHKPIKAGDRFEIRRTLIETRGQGGLFLCAPSPGYELKQGNFAAIPLLTPEERGALIDAARSLSDVAEAAEPPRLSVPLISFCDRPGDEYNARGDVIAVLMKHGWTFSKRVGDNDHWCRPGKKDATSATLNGKRTFYVFSSNAPPFQEEHAYSPFQVFAMLEHGGDFSEAAKSLRSAGYGGSNGNGDVDLSGILARPQPQPAARPGDTPKDPGPVPEAILSAPGLISEVMDFSIQTAPYPNPVMAFCGAVALQAHLAGRKVRDPGDIRSNIYLLALAQSASGKDWPRKVNVRILHEIGAIECLADRFASGEGIQDALFIKPNMLFQSDEIDGMLQSITRAQDARHESIMSTLLTMYSAASTIFPMRRKAGKESPGVIDQPCLTLLGTATPQHYYQALSSRMLTNGFLARMAIFECGPRGKGQEPTIKDLPSRVLTTARWWHDFEPTGGNLGTEHPVPAIVPFTEAGKQLIAETREEIDVEYRKAEIDNDPVATTVWGRAAEYLRKFSLIYACSEDHQSPQIGQEAVRWARRLVMHQVRRTLFMTATSVAENPFHAECLRLLKKLREAPNQTMDHSTLLRRMKTDARSFGQVITTLEQSSQIETIIESTAGRPSRRYKLA